LKIALLVQEKKGSLMLKNIVTLLAERKSFFLNLLYEHIEISLISILIAIIFGLLIGILLSEYQKISKVTLGLINFLYTIPSISLLGFLIPFSGIGDTTAIIALSIYALLPMVRNTFTGMNTIDKDLIEAAKGMGSTRFQILYKIKLPLALPVIMSGIRNMVTMTIALAGIASFIGAGGLGVAIYRGITTNNASMTIIGSLLIAVLAICMDTILSLLDRILDRHKRKLKKSRMILVAAAALIVFLFIGIQMIESNKEEKSIHIATKPMTEQYILGELLSLMIEQDTELKVKLTQGVGGGTSNIQPAMENGEFHIYPEYTGTGWNTVLKKEGLYHENMFPALQAQYTDDLQMSWIGMYGFNNTYGLVVRKEVADQYGLQTYSDLAAVSSLLTFGAEYDFFEREDGYNSLCETYGYHFKNTLDLDIGLKYQAISQGTIDVMNVFTTDGQLSAADVVVLQDDKQFYPSYLCGNVIRNDILEEYPELKNVFQKLEHRISDTDISSMNYQVEVLGKEPKDVAEEFLKELKLLE
jgi:osmoprotectant transport system permease protein